MNRRAFLLIFVVALTLVLCLSALWRSHLAAGGPALEGDQERYYFQAADFARSGFRVSTVPSLNYTGVLFFYGAVFTVFGHNVVAPALVNLLLVAAATLLLIRVGTKIKGRRDAFDWTLGLAILIPEILLHTVMPSRDILAMALLTIAVLAIADHLLGGVHGAITTVVVCAALLLLSVIRTTALIPAVLSILILFAISRNVKLLPALIVIGAAAAALAAAPMLSERLGGYHFTYSRLLSETIDPRQQVLYIFDWHRRSIAKLLIPNNAWQAIAFTPPRLVLYLLAPLPSPGVTWSGLAVGNWASIQNFLTALSSLIYTALFPFALASLWQSIAAERAGLFLHVPFWITILAIAGGTPLIHERYRMMAVLLFAGCIWLGRIATTRRLLWSYAIWGAILVTGGGAAALYKRMPCVAPSVTKEPGSIVIARGESTTLMATVKGSRLEYQWFAGNTGFTGAPIKDATTPSIRVAPPVTSGYWLRASDECGQVDTQTAMVTVK